MFAKRSFASVFSRETTQVLGNVQFLISLFLCRISIANSLNMKHVPPALAGPLVDIIETYECFGSLSFFKFKVFFRLMFFMFVLHH